MLSEAEQDYLKAIYKLLNDYKPVKTVGTSRLAESMGVAAPSVTNMLKNLAELNLVDYAPYRGVRLTREGEKIALEVIRHHRLVELYLAKALGMPWDQVDREAEKWEHFLSDEVEERMAAFLGNPTHDPHGSPIPTKHGTIEPHDATPLAELEPGQGGRIAEVSDHEPALLRDLSGMGLLPQTKITVIAKDPPDGSITVRLGRESKRVDYETARHIHIVKSGEAV